jgi:hypothetical protein
MPKMMEKVGQLDPIRRSWFVKRIRLQKSV